MSGSRRSRSHGTRTKTPPKQSSKGSSRRSRRALTLGDTPKAEKLVASIEAVPAGLRSPYLGAQALRYRGRLATSTDAAVECFEAAEARFRELGVVFWLAVTLLEHGELTGDSALLDEAREIFEDLQATPWLERLDVSAAEPR